MILLLVISLLSVLGSLPIESLDVRVHVATNFCEDDEGEEDCAKSVIQC